MNDIQKHDSHTLKHKILSIIAILIVIGTVLFFTVPKVYDHISDANLDKKLDEYEQKYNPLIKDDLENYKDHFECVKDVLSLQYEVFKGTEMTSDDYISGNYALSKNKVLIANNGHPLSKEPDYPLFKISDDALDSMYYILNDLGYREISFYITENNGYNIIFEKIFESEVTERWGYSYCTLCNYGVSYESDKYIERIKSLTDNNSYPQKGIFEKDNNGIWDYYVHYVSYS